MNSCPYLRTSDFKLKSGVSRPEMVSRAGLSFGFAFPSKKYLVSLASV